MYQQLFLLVFAAQAGSSPELFEKIIRHWPAMEKRWCSSLAQELLQWGFKDCWLGMNLVTFWTVLGLAQSIVSPSVMQA